MRIAVKRCERLAWNNPNMKTVGTYRSQLTNLGGIKLVRNVLKCHGHLTVKCVTTFLQVWDDRNNFRVHRNSVFAFTGRLHL